MVRALLGCTQHFSRQSSCDRFSAFTRIALRLRAQGVFTARRRRLSLEEPANGFPDLGYLSHAKYERFPVVPEY